MAFIRISYFLAAFTILLFFNAAAQKVYYPANASNVLKATAADMAGLLEKAVAGSQFSTGLYNAIPSVGIILMYDSTITDNQLCRVLGNGSTTLIFSASQDNGLLFGVYQYLHELGFKFYQPGSIWQLEPILSSAFKNINKEYNTLYKYKSWFISGGHQTWVMDKETAYNWELYAGENGHTWAQYQRRNGMLGANRFNGHRGDIVSGNYLSTIKSNPCYVACYNGSRQANGSSVPDINNTAAMQLWTNAIEQTYTQYKNNIYKYKDFYVDMYRNFNYYNQYIGIEVPDGPRWGNSKDSMGCNTVDYVSEADQHILLANNTAQKIKAIYPDKHFQVYAYSSHANVPSSNLIIDSSIDVQVVPAAFQGETSARGLLNRWYNRYSSVSEYHYLNIPQWSGEAPLMFLSDLKHTIQRLKEKKSQGINWEASPAKFASLPYLRAANESLVYGIAIDSSLKEFCTEMFGPAALTVYDLLQQWSSDGAVTMGYFLRDNKYKIPLYLQLLQKAVQQAAPADAIVMQRINELKAYLHYVVLYYNWLSDTRSPEAKAGKGAAVCIYLAKINKLQLVNSYYLITGITGQYATGSSFNAAYNIQNGTAYQNGNLPLITDAEIEANYLNDLAAVAPTIQQYNFYSDKQTALKIEGSNFSAAGKINVQIGPNVFNRSEFNIYAKTKGSFTIKYFVKFSDLQKGTLNFTVEYADKALAIVKDLSLKNVEGDGIVNIDLPEAGFYVLSVVSKYHTLIKLEITTNGNVFYKNTAFTHRYSEKYNADMASFPGYYYVPQGLQRIYFSSNNSNLANTGYLTADEISNEFLFKNNQGELVKPLFANAFDSSLFYLEIPAGQSGSFWQITRMGQIHICFANISNNLWYGNLKSCAPAEFSISIQKIGNECTTKLTAAISNASLKWEVNDAGRILQYDAVKEVQLPLDVSPNAIVTLSISGYCSTTKKILDAPNYFQQLESCASAAPLLSPLVVLPVLYPNPSSGIYNFKTDEPDALVQKIIITDIIGRQLASFSNTNTFNVSHLPAGIYCYQIWCNNKMYKGKAVKN